MFFIWRALSWFSIAQTTPLSPKWIGFYSFLNVALSNLKKNMLSYVSKNRSYNLEWKVVTKSSQIFMKSIFNFLPKANVKIRVPNEPEPSETIIGLNLIYPEYDFNSQFWNFLILPFPVIWILLRNYL